MFILIISVTLPIIVSSTLSSIIRATSQGLYTGEIPSLSKSISTEDQHSIYIQTFNSYKFSQFYGDPTLNTKFTLSKQRPSQSLWLIGKQAGEIKIQISLQKKEELKPVPQGVKIFLIDHTQKKIDLQKYVSKIFLYSQDELVSNLYQLRVIIDQKIQSIVNVNLKISMDVPSPLKKPVDQQIEDLHNLLYKVKEDIDNTFLQSLLQWDQITMAINQQINDQHSATNIALFEMLLIIITNVFGFLMLRRELNKKMLV